jgi:hypothetical protein
MLNENCATARRLLDIFIAFDECLSIQIDTTFVMLDDYGWPGV